MAKPAPVRTDIAVLTLIGMIGVGLGIAPDHISDQVRGGFRDALRPGHRASQAVSRWTQTVWNRFRSPTAQEELSDVREELRNWQRQCLSLQVRQADLVQQAIDARRGTTSPFEAERGQPLLVPQLLQAEVLGSERDLLQSRFGRLLDQGQENRIAVDDLVLADDALHLDQGEQAGVQPDMPVLSGRRVAGRIKQVARWTSTLQLVTDPGFRGSAELIRESPQGPLYGAQGVVAGNGDGACRLEHIAATEPVSVGDFVYTIRRQHSLPEPACYGRVMAAELAEGAAHWSIAVQPLLGDEPLASVQVLRELPNPERFPPSPESKSPALQASGAADALPLWSARDGSSRNPRF
jgi:cell shape-determining protein MreC